MTEKAQAYVDSLDIPYNATFVPQSMSRNADEKNPSINWLVSFGSIQTDYMQGIAHMPGYKFYTRRTLEIADREKAAAEQGKYFTRYSHGGLFGGKKIPAPKLVDVLYSLVMDSDVINYDCFEDWAECFGYDTDSREAERIYNACMAIALKLRNLRS
jgi:hypothetical protein